MKKNLKKSKKGFTLIELVVVIAILGILAAILVPVISGFIETANQSTDNANARLVYQAAAMYFASNSGTTFGTEASPTAISAPSLKTYMGMDTFPKGRAQAVASSYFTASIASTGKVTVAIGSLVYDPASGKLS